MVLLPITLNSILAEVFTIVVVLPIITSEVTRNGSPLTSNAVINKSTVELTLALTL